MAVKGSTSAFIWLAADYIAPGAPGFALAAEAPWVELYLLAAPLHAALGDERKAEEVRIGLSILEDIEAGRFRSVPELSGGLNIISCPSCSRVENARFVELAEQVREVTRYAQDHDVTIAVMGCRVNGPGETDDADLGMWCAPTFVNLKRGEELIGKFGYDEVLDVLKTEVDRLIA